MKKIELIKKSRGWYAKFYYEDWTTDYDAIATFGKDIIKLPYRLTATEDEVLQKAKTLYPLDDVFLTTDKQKANEKKKALANVLITKAENFAEAKLKIKVEDPSKIREIDAKALAKAEFEFFQTYKTYKRTQAIAEPVRK